MSAECNVLFRPDIFISILAIVLCATRLSSKVSWRAFRLSLVTQEGDSDPMVGDSALGKKFYLDSQEVAA